MKIENHLERLWNPEEPPIRYSFLRVVSAHTIFQKTTLLLGLPPEVLRTDAKVAVASYFDGFALLIGNHIFFSRGSIDQFTSKVRKTPYNTVRPSHYKLGRFHIKQDRGLTSSCYILQCTLMTQICFDFIRIDIK